MELRREMEEDEEEVGAVLLSVELELEVLLPD
jgi:hypothetical protein